MATDNETFAQWALVEIMGRLKLAGMVTEQVIAGQGFVRVDVPSVDGQEGYTRLFGPGSIYSITPCAEEIARRYCERNHTKPVTIYELAAPKPEIVDVEEDGDEDGDGDEDDFREHVDPDDIPL
jgi:hypothetical protein